jgi:hypothetical protein
MRAGASRAGRENVEAQPGRSLARPDNLGPGSPDDHAATAGDQPVLEDRPDALARHLLRSNFPAAARVDNPWYPLVPGTQYLLEGRANRGEGRQPHRVIFTVTDLTKVIDGVRPVVIWDRDINEGQLEESELAFQAQDNDGNVWLHGEYPERWTTPKRRRWCWSRCRVWAQRPWRRPARRR